MGEMLPPPRFVQLLGVTPALTDLESSAAAELLRLAERVQETRGYVEFFVWEVSFSDLSFETAFQMRALFAKALGGKRASIYSIHLVDGPSAEQVLGDLKAVKDTCDKKYPRLGKIAECQGSNTLYVGSSQSTAKRLAEHLGACPKDTYGLRLGDWARHWPGKVRIEVRTFDDCPPYILQILEDHLASKLTPILGKRGGK